MLRGRFGAQVVSHSSASAIPPFLNRKSIVAQRLRKPTSNNHSANGRILHWSQFDGLFCPQQRVLRSALKPCKGLKKPLSGITGFSG
jgi:hypothetical protein